MDTERARTHLLGLPHVVESMQWGEKLVFWVADKAIGGKMFALIDLACGNRPPIAFAVGHERAAELGEREGLLPAPYLARAGWVAAERWDVLRGREWQAELSAAHAYVLARLPARTLAVLAMPETTRARMVLERRQWLAAKAAAKKARAAV